MKLLPELTVVLFTAIRIKDCYPNGLMQMLSQLCKHPASYHSDTHFWIICVGGLAVRALGFSDHYRMRSSDSGKYFGHNSQCDVYRPHFICCAFEFPFIL